MQHFRALFFCRRANIGDFLPKSEGSELSRRNALPSPPTGTPYCAPSETGERAVERMARSEGAHVSGAQLARELGVTRNSVWKAVNALRREGYHIDATTNRGYALSHEDDLLSASGIRRFLPADAPLFPTVRKCLDSTNAEALRRAVDGAPEGTVIVAEEQTAGRGRRGRSFFSPAGTGIYLSILVRPALAAERAHLLTCSAAVAVAEAIEACAGVDASIKWVNDVYCRRKKVAGILTEGSFDLEGGVLQHAVVGIGVNVRPPHAGFPAEIAERAGAVQQRKGSFHEQLSCACGLLESMPRMEKTHTAQKKRGSKRRKRQ